MQNDEDFRKRKGSRAAWNGLVFVHDRLLPKSSCPYSLARYVFAPDRLFNNCRSPRRSKSRPQKRNRHRNFYRELLLRPHFTRGRFRPEIQNVAIAPCRIHRLRLSVLFQDYRRRLPKRIAFLCEQFCLSSLFPNSVLLKKFHIYLFF